VHVYQQKDSDGVYEDIEMKAQEEDVTVRKQKRTDDLF
jgi:hypothetical protein